MPPSPTHLGPWLLPVEPPQRGLLPSPPAPGCAFLLIILSQPLFLSPHGGDTQDTQDRMESLGLSWGELRSVGCHGDTRGPAPEAAGFQEGAPALPPRGSPPSCPCFHPFLCPPNMDWVPTVCSGD